MFTFKSVRPAQWLEFKAQRRRRVKLLFVALRYLVGQIFGKSLSARKTPGVSACAAEHGSEGVLSVVAADVGCNRRCAVCCNRRFAVCSVL